MPAGGLRARVAAQLEGMLGSAELDARGPRASVMLTANYRHGARTPVRERLWSGMVERYLARQCAVIREGRAALLTAGVPGAGKSSVVSQLGLVDEGWRRLDATR
jgi:hypothetical protein